VRDFKELKVWQRAHPCTLDVYRHTKSFPSEERYGLTSQIRRAAVSVPSNIAEGCGRGSERDFCRFLSIAAGSASETEYQLLLARDIDYLTDEVHRSLNDQINEIKRMLNSLIRKISKQQTANS